MNKKKQGISKFPYSSESLSSQPHHLQPVRAPQPSDEELKGGGGHFPFSDWSKDTHGPTVIPFQKEITEKRDSLKADTFNNGLQKLWEMLE